jgi:hypothetical protein
VLDRESRRGNYGGGFRKHGSPTRLSKCERKCITVARGISDTFYRDTALHFIFVLCRRANDEAAAKRIFEEITTDEIRGKILDGRPALFD